VAGRVAASGVGVMALGAALFTVGWGYKIKSLVEAAFFVSLAGWMLLVIGSAFFLVSVTAGMVGHKKRREP
jgi:hypothetical protein